MANRADDDALLELQERLIKRSFEEDYQRQFPDREANFQKGIFLNEEQGDWALLFYLLGRFIPEASYKIIHCVYCNDIINEAHLVERCREFNILREGLLTDLRKLGIMIQQRSLHILINNLQFEESIHNLNQADRMRVLNNVKKFVHEIRDCYLKSIEEHKVIN